VGEPRFGSADQTRQAIGAPLTGENVAEAGTLDETELGRAHDQLRRQWPGR